MACTEGKERQEAFPRRISRPSRLFECFLGLLKAIMEREPFSVRQVDIDGQLWPQLRKIEGFIPFIQLHVQRLRHDGIKP